MTDDEIAETLMRLAQERKAGKIFCPSEAARALCGEWRDLMPLVRGVAAGLPLAATRKGMATGPVKARGPIRLELAEGET